ncbi:hypothetical protein K2173_020748 [Erythroxylum novogranatense]|uniref:Uncharacterized protein n=1 Tax=Erythroxylum novogranatense TaxID=1862640 RepID=A0AAV8TPP5_9ROSI|nr:hypothetical protein K2173_020748 [Erythroxylum novogranatense]
MKVTKTMSSSKVEEEAKRRKPPSPDDERKYLSMRERIKQEIRKQRNTLSTSVQERANYGSFFGPSETHIAKRVIEESKSLLAKGHLPLLSISNSNTKMVSTGTKTGSIPLLSKEQYMEVQKLRDYSFLFSDDGDPPTPAKSVTVVDKSNVDRNSNTRCEGRKSMPAHAGLRKSTISALRAHRYSRSCNERPKDLPSSRNSGTVMEKKQVKQTSPHDRPKRRAAAQIYDDDDYNEESANALSMIRRMFNTQRFADRDDGDCIIETSFHEIMKEEKRSAKIARKEDQLILIAKEEQMRKSAKK